MSLLVKAAIQGLLPDRVQTVSSWADEHRVLSSKDSSEPGRYRTDRTPYMREINDCLSNDSLVEEVDFMAGAQISKTTGMLNWMGYVMDVSPGPMLIVQPTVDLAKRFSRQRVAPMIEETTVLNQKVSSLKRDSENTMLMKAFPGGSLILAGANSAAGLRSMPIRYLGMDEIDAYPDDVEGEGDPIELAKKRTTTFNRRKIFKTSTPTLKGLSKIEKEFLKGDQRYYYVPCPHCGHEQHLKWDNLKYIDNDPKTAKYLCEGCHVLIEERYKTKMLMAGRWIPHGKCSPKRRSYHLNSLYSPLGWKSWESIVADFLEAKNDKATLKVWVNTTLAETWEDEYSQRLDPNNLMARAEDYKPHTAPERVVFATMAFDIQDDRFAYGIEGWAPGEENWKLAAGEIYADPTTQEYWDKMLELIKQPIMHASGAKIYPLAVAIDSGGHYTQRVYEFATKHRSLGVIAVKGRSASGMPIIGKPTKIQYKISGSPVPYGGLLYMVGVDGAKSTIMRRLTNQIEGPGYVHFPQSFGKEYYDQLTSEVQKPVMKNGMPTRVWVTRSGVRNEFLDVAVYNMAALYYVYLKYGRTQLWENFKQKIINSKVLNEVEEKAENPYELPKTNGIPRKKSKFWA